MPKEINYSKIKTELRAERKKAEKLLEKLTKTLESAIARAWMEANDIKAGTRVHQIADDRIWEILSVSASICSFSGSEYIEVFAQRVMKDGKLGKTKQPLYGAQNLVKAKPYLQKN